MNTIKEISIHNCPNCDYSDSSKLFNPDLSYKKFTSNYFKCKKCSLIFQNPIIHPSNLGDFYDENYFQSINQLKFGFIKSLKFRLKIRRIKKLAHKHHKVPMENLKIIELGCGDGNLVNELSNQGYDIHAQDIVDGRFEENKGSSYPFYEEEISEINQKFDYILLRHVIEHVPDITKFKIDLASICNDNAIIYVETPNSESKSFEKFREDWHDLSFPFHTYIFNKNTLQQSMRPLFEMIRISQDPVPFGWSKNKPKGKVSSFISFITGLLRDIYYSLFNKSTRIIVLFRYQGDLL